MMDIRLIDRSRTVTYATHCPPAPDDDLFAFMRDLLRHMPASSIANGQAEFECDPEFARAVTAQSKLSEPIKSFDGVTVFIIGKDKPAPAPVSVNAPQIVEHTTADRT
jgi:hypothetical protein